MSEITEATTMNDNAFITLEEFAETIGVPEYHLRNAAKAEEFPCRKVGKSYVALREDLKAWISKSTLKTTKKRRKNPAVVSAPRA